MRVALRVLLVIVFLWGSFVLMRISRTPDAPCEAPKKTSKVRAMHCSSLAQGAPRHYVEIVPAPLPPWAADYDAAAEVNEESREERRASFERLWDTKAWSGGAKKGPPSGRGSSLENTRQAAAALHLLLSHAQKELGRREVTLLDLPCGDQTWMPSVISQRPEIRYVGADIVRSAVEHHSKNPGAPNMEFRVMDAAEEAITFPVDVIFCRHMLQHLPNDAVRKVLRHFSSSGARFLITTDYPDWAGPLLELRSPSPGSKAVDVRVRKLNLRNLGLPAPICYTHDFSESFIGLWELPFSVDI